MEKFVALKASAGSGKTFSLVARYLSLLFLKANASEILALTFTNKAANEMRERVYNTLINLEYEPNYIENISAQTNLPKEMILEEKNRVLKEFLNSEVKIYTIDKFIHQILRSFSFEAQIPRDFSITSQKDDILKFEFLKTLSVDELDDFIFFELFENKKLNSVIDIFESLDEKANEIENFNIKQTVIDTALENEILKKAFLIKDVIQNSDNLDKRASGSVDFFDIKSLLEKGKTWLTKNSLNDFSYFKKLKNEQIEVVFQDLKKDLGSYFANCEEYLLYKMFRLFKKYSEFKREFKKSSKEFDFKDITNLVYNLLNKNFDRDFIYFKLDANFSHLLVDEFQDTSIVQYKILKPLIDEIIAGYGRSDFRTFFYVGDTKQSIYRFRGGHKELFDFVFDEYKDFGIVEQKLDSNYRSKKNIVDFVNSCFRDLIDGYFDQHCKNSGGFVEVLESDKDNIQILAIDKLKELLNKNIEPDKIAILGFRNDELFEVAEFIKEQIPHIDIVTDATKKLIVQQNIQAVINYVKYLYFKEDLYKLNFLSLVGKDYLNDDIEILKYDNLLDLIYKVANKYELIDEDMMLFFEIVTKYKDIDEFVYNIDYLNDSVVKKHQKGLKVLTIHKSKGLEFEHVILLDKIGSSNNKKLPLIFDYDGISLKSIKYRFSLRDSFDIEYKNALENEKKKESEDLKHQLYVALTRAKESLIIIKKSKNSSFDMLNLKQMQIGSIEQPTNIKQETKKDEIFKITPKKYGKQEDFVTLKNSEIMDYKAINFGIAMHYTLEILSTFSKNSLKNCMKSTYNRFGALLSQDEFSDIENRISMLLENQLFQKIVDGKVYKEQPISYNHELKQIDLLIEKESEIIVCDYKSATFKQKEYKTQIIEYTKAVRDIFKKPTTGFLIFLHTDSVEIREICKIGY